MFRKFYPEEYVDSTYQIDFKKLYQKGYRGVIFDIDNTLVPHGAKADKRAADFFQNLKEIGFSCCLLSNNKEERVKIFYKRVRIPYIYNAHKPSRKGYEQAMDFMKTDKKNTLFVGDQIFTDIYGANRTGIYSILVKPIHPREEIQIVCKRKLEKMVLYFYGKKQKGKL